MDKTQLTRNWILEQAKPILFNTEMTIALQEGRKTRTRRAMKPQPRLVQPNVPGMMPYWKYMDEQGDDIPFFPEERSGRSPYRVGQFLYVREAWCDIWDRRGGWLGYGYRAKGEPSTRNWGIWRSDDDHTRFRWRPSIHMPREAARLFLRITGFRVEQLQEMDEEEAVAEGFPDSGLGSASPLERFSVLWDLTLRRENIGLTDWDANPWVYVYEFERVVLHER